MATAREVAKELSERTDLLNTKLETAERGLVALQLGVSAHVNISSGEDLEDDRYTQLWFKKDGGQWRLVVRHGSESYDDRANETVIANASKAQRIAAARGLSELVERLLEIAKSQLVDLDDAVQSVDQVLENLPAVPDADSFSDEVPF